MNQPPQKKRPSLKRPGVDRSEGFGGQYAPVRTNYQPASQAPETTAVPEPPRPERSELQQTAPAVAKPEPKEPAAPVASAVSEESTPRRKPRGQDKADGQMRRISLLAYPKQEHKAAIDALATGEITAKDIVKLAGRRAAMAFVPKATYVPAADTPRLGMSYRYGTTKNLSASVLDALHAAKNPLGLKSDNELLRGQFEPLFWSNLDAVIKDLQGRQRK